jgi:hypothetical protein
MNPKDLLGSPVMQGKCSDNTIDVLVKGEFAVFVVFKNGSYS